MNDASFGHRPMKRFPPPRGNLLVPRDSRPATLRGIEMYSAVSRKAAYVRHVAWLLVAGGGSRLLPGRTQTWAVPAGWTELAQDLQRNVARFDSVVVYSKPQQHRPGFSTLLVDGERSVAFVKVDADGEALRAEADIAQLVQGTDPASFWIAPVIGRGDAGGLHYVAYEPLEQGLHRAAAPTVALAIIPEVQKSLARLERPSNTPQHWEPAHGDFAPWNVRITRSGKTAVIDWEDAHWAPPGADAVYYLAALRAVRNDHTPMPGYDEARAYWKERVTARPWSSSEATFRTRLLEGLGGP
jgi:hypothetical protein